MHRKAVLLVSIFSFLAASNAVPADINVPITHAERSALYGGGLQRRGNAKVNKPITKAEWKALEAAGLDHKDRRASLTKRDKVMNCGHLVTGYGGSNGHGKWIPVKDFSDVADEFCSAYVGTDIFEGHETSDTYPINLTNQDDDTQPGPPGNIVFAIYNTEKSGTWVVNHDTCLRAMKAPLGSHAVKRDGYVRLIKRDNCWGSDHNDYEGGYYEVSDIGAFGSEVYGAS
ncbi:MAG: hypothetical protein Q9214_002534 [Letrouitia sp. 1 TL-2023]